MPRNDSVLPPWWPIGIVILIIAMAFFYFLGKILDLIDSFPDWADYVAWGVVAVMVIAIFILLIRWYRKNRHDF